MDKAIKVLLFVFIGALVVLVLTHASGFSTAVTAVGGQVSNIGSGLSGSGFVTSGKPNTGLVGTKASTG